ncbi:MAG: hypothetical protein AAF591_03310 [Verrucomicrobiota bacterium]
MTTLAAAAAVALSFAAPDDDPTTAVVRATGVPESSDAGITLHLLHNNRTGPAMFGKTIPTDTGLEFRPAVKLSRGANYRAVLHLPNADPITIDYKVPALDAPAPKLVKVFPTAKKLPANLLKFHLYFDQPMREGRAIFDQIHIEDHTGKRVHAPWRRQERWSDDARHLILLIHPGRIKRGVNLREELGPVLLPDQKYTLLVDANVTSAAGKPIGQETRYPFLTSPEDHERPLPENWTLSIPAAGTRDPLRIESPEPLDHLLIPTHMAILDSNESPLAVDTKIEDGEQSWLLTPAKPWSASPHYLVVDDTLEDLAGNTPQRIFDNDLTLPEPAPGARSIPFTPPPIKH